MSDTNNKSEKSNPVVAYEVVQVQNDKLKLIQGRYALSKNELNNLEGMIISCDGKYEIIKDEKTGKILRVEDNRSISEINQDKYKRMIETYKKKQGQEQEH